MTAFDRLAEERIQEATERGLFRDLPAQGKPLDLEDLSALPDELRVSYVLLRSVLRHAILRERRRSARRFR